jgi:valyl-tRNA synthetase
MILMSTYLLGEIPFHTVYLHGLVRDKQGKKISKSLGNNIDPLDMAEKYGADAIRMSLIIGSAPGNDSKTSEDKIRSYRNFTTKIWNAARFVLTNLDGRSVSTTSPHLRLTAEDKRNLKRLEEVKKKATKHIEDYKFHQAAELLYQYFWHTFADKIIEKYKGRLRAEDCTDRAAAQGTLVMILRECLKMLHPFVPFVTEAVWEKMPGSPRQKSKMLMTERW